MSLSHFDALNKVAAAVVTVAVESVSSSFSVIIVVGIKINFVMEAMESVFFSLCSRILVVAFVFVVVLHPPSRPLSHLDE